MKKPDRTMITTFLKNLRDVIIQKFESFEKEHRFIRKNWDHTTGGGGEISLLRGNVFEKAAVNWSAVSGPHYPLKDKQGPFFATGISLITHMYNPHAPTVHMNIRYIETEDEHWFGGGYDLTPMGFPYEEDTKHFHQTAKNALDAFDLHFYPQFSKNAAEYFYIPHWKKERGQGGIFFDHLNTGCFENDYKMWQNIGKAFLNSIIPIYEKRISTPYQEIDREKQLQMRSQYVEFNLLYDRGTKFGFQSGGNPEAILCSMPPLVKW